MMIPHLEIAFRYYLVLNNFNKLIMSLSRLAYNINYVYETSFMKYMCNLISNEITFGWLDLKTNNVDWIFCVWHVYLLLITYSHCL